MFPIYLGGLLFGGILIVASIVLGQGDGDHAAGDGDHAGEQMHDGHPAPKMWVPLLNLRFWSFAFAFFGVTGLVFTWLGTLPGLLVPLVAAGVGVGAGAAASKILRVLSKSTVGTLPEAGALVGREGKLLLPVARGQRGKLRLTTGGVASDLIAETDGDEPLGAGATVLIVGLRGNVAVVERAPAGG
jgi:membrane protein implicated in regulation of membrane protease activity